MAPRWPVVGAFLLLVASGCWAKKLELDPVTAKLMTCYQDDNSLGEFVSIRCNPKDAPQTVISFRGLRDDPNVLSCSQDEDGRFPNTVYCEHDNGNFKYTLHEGGGISVQSNGGATSVVNGGGNVAVNNVGGGGFDGGLGTRGGFGAGRRRPSKDSKYEPVEVPDVTVPPVVVPPVRIPPVIIPPVNVPTVNIPPVNIPAVNIPAINIPSVSVRGTASPDVDSYTRYYTPDSYTRYYTPYVYTTRRSYYSGYNPSSRSGFNRGQSSNRAYSNAVRSSGGSSIYNMMVDGNEVRVVRGGGGASVVTVNVDGRRVSAVTSGTGNRIITGYLPGVDMEAFFDNVMQHVQ